jgi:hypothetical protein
MEQTIENGPRSYVFEPGVEVVLRIGKRELAGRVVENRGFIGLDGTQIVRIQVFPQDVEEPVMLRFPSPPFR